MFEILAHANQNCPDVESLKKILKTNNKPKWLETHLFECIIIYKKIINKKCSCDKHYGRNLLVQQKEQYVDDYFKQLKKKLQQKQSKNEQSTLTVCQNNDNYFNIFIQHFHIFTYVCV